MRRPIKKPLTIEDVKLSLARAKIVLAERELRQSEIESGLDQDPDFPKVDPVDLT